MASAGARAQNYFLDAGGLLTRGAPAAAGSREFEYDPARPTPSLFGPTIEGKAGSGDIGALERRADVVVFTSETLENAVDVIGAVAAEVYFRSNTQHTDLYLCLCDVNAAGVSTNICDGYRTQDGSTRKVAVEFWPTAYRFERGHRIRVIVGSGGHPRYVRNLGTGDALGEGQRTVVQQQEIMYGPEYPSAISLSVVGGIE